MANTIVFLVLALMASSSLITPSTAQCETYSFGANTEAFTNCQALPVLNSFLHWTYTASTSTLRMAYRHTDVSDSTWVAWGINPTSATRAMPGAYALYAAVSAGTISNVNMTTVGSYERISELLPGSVRYPVTNLSATYENREVIIFATWTLPAGGTINQVWQAGPVSGGSLRSHSVSNSVNMNSKGVLNLTSGTIQSVAGSGNTLKKRNTHGVLNAVSWGILMPIGAVTARYLKVFQSADPAWFYLHVTCQTVAYIVGVAGWGTGLKLGSDSPGITHNPHRSIGIALFCLGTLQVFALLLRPKKDHKLRVYWSAYHHMVGYAVIALSIVNVFEGFEILQPEKIWKRAYTGIIIAIGAVAVVLECYTWFYVIKKKKSENKTVFGAGAANGANGYGSSSRTHNEV